MAFFFLVVYAALVQGLGFSTVYDSEYHRGDTQHVPFYYLLFTQGLFWGMIGFFWLIVEMRRKPKTPAGPLVNNHIQHELYRAQVRNTNQVVTAAVLLPSAIAIFSIFMLMERIYVELPNNMDPIEACTLAHSYLVLGTFLCCRFQYGKIE